MSMSATTAKGYRLIREIGAGGMGTVYEARMLMPLRNEHPVAIKVIRTASTESLRLADASTLAGKDEYLRLFAREAMTAIRLNHNHANLATAYDWGVSKEGLWYLVMEFINGPSLHRLRSRARLPYRIIRRIAVDVLDGLAFLHRHGVLHRDVSASNILLSNEGPVKIVDFGFAKRVDSSHSGMVRGTAAYASPEALQGVRLNVLSDLYSLAAVLYELITGVPPYGADEPVRVYMNMLRSEPVPLPTDIPADLRQIISGLLMFQSQERTFVSARQALAVIYDCDQEMADDVEMSRFVSEHKACRDEANVSSVGGGVHSASDFGEESNDASSEQPRLLVPAGSPERVAMEGSSLAAAVRREDRPTKAHEHTRDNEHRVTVSIHERALPAIKLDVLERAHLTDVTGDGVRIDTEIARAVERYLTDRAGDGLGGDDDSDIDCSDIDASEVYIDVDIREFSDWERSELEGASSSADALRMNSDDEHSAANSNTSVRSSRLWAWLFAATGAVLLGMGLHSFTTMATSKKAASQLTESSSVSQRSRLPHSQAASSTNAQPERMQITAPDMIFGMVTLAKNALGVVISMSSENPPAESARIVGVSAKTQSSLPLKRTLISRSAKRTAGSHVRGLEPKDEQVSSQEMRRSQESVYDSHEHIDASESMMIDDSDGWSRASPTDSRPGRSRAYEGVVGDQRL